MRFEHRREPLVPLSKFVWRLARSLAIGLALVGLSLIVGIVGYRRLFGLSWIDAFVNASMMLSGMGPLTSPRTLRPETLCRPLRALRRSGCSRHRRDHLRARLGPVSAYLHAEPHDGSDRARGDDANAAGPILPLSFAVPSVPPHTG